ncbi:hypothetical protein [Streptomyces sp. NBC_01361]|uniref:hypothetical protein n=1 Tax=Streptomyces sp. NBC_01361 TaxID=2903838 RepID=UPI002E34A7EB|nr:hypothetical protein [Streptomyces sp. NBC_01361]
MSGTAAECNNCGTQSSARYCGEECCRAAQNRRRREKRRHDSRQRAARHAASELLTWGGLWNGDIPTVTPADVVAKTTVMYGNYRDLQDISVDEATEALVALLERRGLPVLLTAEEQSLATSADVMVVSHARTVSGDHR